MALASAARPPPSLPPPPHRPTTPANAPRAAAAPAAPAPPRRSWDGAGRPAGEGRRVRLEEWLRGAQSELVEPVEEPLRRYLAAGTDEPLILEALARGCLQTQWTERAYH